MGVLRRLLRGTGDKVLEKAAPHVPNSLIELGGKRIFTRTPGFLGNIESELGKIHKEVLFEEYKEKKIDRVIERLRNQYSLKKYRKALKKGRAVRDGLKLVEEYELVGRYFQDITTQLKVLLQELQVVHAREADYISSDFLLVKMKKPRVISLGVLSMVDVARFSGDLEEHREKLEAAFIDLRRDLKLKVEGIYLHRAGKRLDRDVTGMQDALAMLLAAAHEIDTARQVSTDFLEKIVTYYALICELVLCIPRLHLDIHLVHANLFGEWNELNSLVSEWKTHLGPEEQEKMDEVSATVFDYLKQVNVIIDQGFLFSHNLADSISREKYIAQLIYEANKWPYDKPTV